MYVPANVAASPDVCLNWFCSSFDIKDMKPLIRMASRAPPRMMSM